MSNGERNEDGFPLDAENDGSVYVDELAEHLGCGPDEALALLRRVGPRGVVRTAEGRFLIPRAAVEQLRAASASGQ